MARTKRARARRKSTRRTSARRPKKATRRQRAKGPRLTRKSQKQILVAVAIVVGILLLIFLLQNTRTYVQKRWYGGEVGSNAVYGKITGVAIGAFGRGTIHVQSFNTGKVYTFYVGKDTNYSPHRYPSPGENAKVYYIYDRGYLKSTLVKIR
jgi:uncharacterized integral membrane protein